MIYRLFQFNINRRMDSFRNLDGGFGAATRSRIAALIRSWCAHRSNFAASTRLADAVIKQTSSSRMGSNVTNFLVFITNERYPMPLDKACPCE